MNTFLDLLADRTCYWWLGQAGAAVQILGAAVLVFAAFRTRRQIKDVADTWDAELAGRLRDVIAGQAFTALFGFTSLTAGLFLQILGSLGR